MRIQTGDIWGGISAALVALPAAIGFGVAIYEPLGQSYNAQGAIAGMVGATLLGIVAAKFGSCQRLISAPCAPAAAVLSAIAIQMGQAGMPASQMLLAFLLISVFAAFFQILFGLSKLGNLIKFMPYPVVAGYLSGVGLIIVSSQTPKWLGVTGNSSLWSALHAPDLWRTPSLLIGFVAMVLMWGGPHITKRVPAVILALTGGICMYWVLAIWDTSLQGVAGNTYIVGPLGQSNGLFDLGNTLEGLTNLYVGISKPWEAIFAMQAPPLMTLLYPSLTLAVLLSIDTLKTCVVLDTLTHSRHDSNRELMGQGFGNLAAAVCSGMPGAGTMGATLVNISSGARTSNSGLVEGFAVLLAYLLLTPFLTWIPIAALGGILTVVGLKMIDLHSFSLLRNRETRLDFLVVITVAVVAQIFSLIVATGTGLVLAAILFLRKQINEHTVRRITLGNQIFSKNKRLEREREVLEKNGSKAVILELQGALFFGTANQLYQAVEPYINQCRYLVLDLRMVQSVDYSAVHVIEQIRDRLSEIGGELLLSDLPSQLPSGEDLRNYFSHTGVLHEGLNIRAFNELDDALEWMEEQWLAKEGLWPRADRNYSLRDFDVFAGRSEDTLSDLSAAMETRHIVAGEKLFSLGEASNEIFFIVRGEVRIDILMPDGRQHHMATHHQGDFIGEMGFLDGRARADFAVAVTDVEVMVLTREKFDLLADNHRRLGSLFMLEIARVLASRLRQTSNELKILGSA